MEITDLEEIGYSVHEISGWKIPFNKAVFSDSTRDHVC